MMDRGLKQAIIEGAANVTISVSASDLKDIVEAIYDKQRCRAEEAAARDRQKPTLTKQDTMKALGVSYETLRRWAKDEYLTPVKIGRKVMYRQCDIEDMLTKRAKQAI